ncbi:MAG TPA: preprotein translocase subunit SecG [Deltaproteobacteria bacterium]|nr:preprotein translocase subunit SecG [Deltaproteobacteria bacterium]
MFVVALHVVLCLFLILIIILQPGKGGDVGAAFGGGGGGSTVFGPRGPTGLLQRATTVVAVLFMATSVTLALYSDRGARAGGNVDDAIDRFQQQQELPEEVEIREVPEPEAVP